ncbi:YusW family protein [Bacillus nakamurai]|uniref:YusW family protein n=1 Tax=Bacillus nakamurai TaxID=1793963 RepID=UPI001E3E6AA1|nr:YusW family protein [Bacillus nakamurai]MCC9023166.1 YusW family protein [Bacillus nakamurai]MCP6681718.1 YusW family protein [Bacillus nakamurai]
MKWIRTAGAVCITLMLIAGCRLNEQEREAKEDITPVSSAKPVPYESFSLRVNYGDGEHNRYEGMYEKKGRDEKADIQDKLSGVHREGEEALDEMKMILGELALNSRMPEREVVRQVLSAFNLDSHYDHFYLKLKKSDGEMTEIKN